MEQFELRYCVVKYKLDKVDRTLDQHLSFGVIPVRSVQINLHNYEQS